MPDDFDLRAPGPRTWTDAFAALPAESAGADGWARLSAALDARPVTHASTPIYMWGRRLRIAAALAAAVAIAAVVPQLVLRDDASSTVPASPPRATPATIASPSPSRAGVAAPHVATPVDRAPADATRVERMPPATSTRDTGARPTVRVARLADANRQTRPRAVETPRYARTDVAPPDAAATPAIAAATSTDPPPADALQGLYAESAQLEALLALTRDDRVASAGGALLTGELDARIAVIDAALAEPDLAPTRRVALWQRRVATLRDLTGVESTERWLAASGEALGDALVRVD